MTSLRNFSKGKFIPVIIFFSGLLFWNHILKKFEDIVPFSKSLGPYIICENEKWKLDKNIDISNYELTKQAIEKTKPDLIFHLAAESHVECCWYI